MIVTTPDQTISQILNSYILHTAALPSPVTNSGGVHQEKIKHLHYLNDFRTQQCPLFLDHKCQAHRPFACFNWHFPNQRRRRPVKKSDGTFNYNPDVYCTSYDENTGLCPNGDECQYVHRNAGDTERRYHPRYYKTGQCIYETTEAGSCVKNGQHCAFAHGIDDLRQPVYDIREVQDAAEHIANLPATLEKERVLSEDPKWNDMVFVLAHYKTQLCKKPPRMCRQGYACPYYHNGKDRRRNPHRHRYRSTPCPQVKPSGDDWRDSGQCEAQDECAYCHTRTEQQFHPEIYKSTKCNDMIHDGFCPRGPFCAFAHGESEASIGRDFLVSSSSTPPGGQLQLLEDKQLDIERSSDANEISSEDEATLFYQASVTAPQLGIGMLGLSALSSSTIHYLQSLLSAQSQIMQQYSSVSLDSGLKPAAQGVSTCSSIDSGLSSTDPTQHMPPPLHQQQLQQRLHRQQQQQHQQQQQQQQQQQMSSRDQEEENEEDEQYPNMNIIIGHVLGESFNCGSLSEVDLLPDHRAAVIPSGPGSGLELGDSVLFEELEPYSLEPEPDAAGTDEGEDICPEMTGGPGAVGTATSAPLSIPGSGGSSQHGVIGGGHHRSVGPARTWANGGAGSPVGGSSSGFGDSVPAYISHSLGGRLMLEQNCRVPSAGSPASQQSHRLPQSPIMLQSPFSNAACDLERLVVERELADVRGQLNETQRELCSMRHQRDVVLMQLQESWRLIQTLVAAPSTSSCEIPVSGSSGGGVLETEANKENLQLLSDLTKLLPLMRVSNGGPLGGTGNIGGGRPLAGPLTSGSASSSPDQNRSSLHSSHSTCTLKE